MEMVEGFIEWIIGGYEIEFMFFWPIFWAFLVGFCAGRTWMYWKVDRILDRYGVVIGVDNATFIHNKM